MTRTTQIALDIRRANSLQSAVRSALTEEIAAIAPRRPSPMSGNGSHAATTRRANALPLPQK